MEDVKWYKPSICPPVTRYDPAILFIDVHPRSENTSPYKNTCTDRCPESIIQDSSQSVDNPNAHQLMNNNTSSTMDTLVCLATIYVSGGQRTTSGIPQELSTWLFETGSLIGLELTK